MHALKLHALVAQLGEQWVKGEPRDRRGERLYRM